MRYILTFAAFFLLSPKKVPRILIESLLTPQHFVLEVLQNIKRVSSKPEISYLVFFTLTHILASCGEFCMCCIVTFHVFFPPSGCDAGVILTLRENFVYYLLMWIDGHPIL